MEDNQILYADPNYNQNLGLLHPEFEAEAFLWDGFNSDKIQLKILSPLDLAFIRSSASSQSSSSHF